MQVAEQMAPSTHAKIQEALSARRSQPQENAQYLTFQVAGATYAMAIATIKELIEFGTITTIPLMPTFIRGVINLRGAVVPVIDLAARLGFDAATPHRRTCIVIVEMKHEDETFDMGVVVDGVKIGRAHV